MQRKAFKFTFKEITWLVFLMYACILIKMILFKRPPSYYYRHFLYNLDWDMMRANYRRANLVPFKTIMLFINSRLSMRDIVGNLLGNILGFVPFGILIPMLFPSFSTLRSVLLAAFVVSLVFEFLQLIAVLGSFDVDDLLLNTLGAALGFYIFFLDRKKKYPSLS